MAGPPKQTPRQGQLAIQNCRRSRQAEETVPSVRMTRATSGRGRSRTRCETVQNHPAGHLSHYATDDRQAECMTSLRVLAVASEIYPIIKTGGLADVVGSLPVALRSCGLETRTLVPGY